MTATIPLHIRNGEPRIFDIDLAIALGMPRPINLRTGLMVMAHQTLVNCGRVDRAENGCYLNEEQALAICSFSTSRKAAEAGRRVVETFRQFHGETLPQMDVRAVISNGLAPCAGLHSDGRAGMIADALRSKLGRSLRRRKYVTLRKRLPASKNAG